ncbi:sodium-coupled monocarboxylate transporter 2-like [Amblyomma americanum]
MVLGAEYVVFGTLMALNLGLGIYFSVPRKERSQNTTSEAFLGSRAMRPLPLAASVVASLISSTGLIGLTGHFYAYGFHFMWTSLTTLAVSPIATWLFLPVLYTLRVTSVFEYIRLRFDSVISITICLIYILLTQTIGALSIHAASLTITTVFGAPLIWCNIGIGLCGTVYTALGGLRGVVWTDCMQLLFILIGPTTVVAKIIIDWNTSEYSPQPMSDFDLRSYIANVNFNPTHDENVWVAVAAVTSALYRVGMDQVVVQRCMASRTLASAKKTVYLGAVLLVFVNVVKVAMAVALVLWFRGCDPQLSGDITTYDQILPFYIKTYLVTFPGFTGLFLAAVVSAATSTISSVINTQAAIVFVDILPPCIKKLNFSSGWFTRGLAFFLGVVVTLYSCVCVYLGSVTRTIIMVTSAATGPSIGLLILAVAFPFVHSKGAGISTLIMFAVQLVFMWLRIQSGIKPPLMPVTLDYCQENSTYWRSTPNNMSVTSSNNGYRSASFLLLSSFWNSMFSTCGTVILGIIISFATGEHKKPTASACHLNSSFVTLWRKLGVVASSQVEHTPQDGRQDHLATTALLWKEDVPQSRTML